MITVRSLVPLSIAVLVVGLVTGSLLANGSAMGPWLLAALLLAHGLLHVAFAIPRPAGVSDWPFDLARSWLVVRAGVDAGLVRAIGRVLVAAIVAGLTLAAVGALGFIIPPDAWTFVVAGAASLSLVLLAIAFAAMVLVGVGIDLALIWFALSAVWTPAATLA